ncbi:PIG-L deacetylase family protein [Pseudofrankia inefficax]|uniref:LmbE family protein n=1 Tax=Pseudofrankia inefficax (strain DSM 45817 / CECT 9037 / DDB 130130 / EuI1c) TaxID=298654 RepID=E3J8H8_PSEI1|nr:PIG-L family deacetylase [Pseudofrankia inefficax]ADP84512.1 LmbE family protein [Pseudofrankia inefficax]
MVLTEAGTAEAVWQTWLSARSWPSLDWPTLCQSIGIDGTADLLVVAPHPDDETLGVGGLMALARAAGATVTVVAVTDGDASHPRSPTVRPTELVGRRARERRDALAELGLADVEVHRLGIPDGTVDRHVHQVAGLIEELLRPGMTCLATFAADGHPDHDAVGAAAARACLARRVPLVEYPVWTWHWATPGDPRVPWDRAVQVRLPPRVAQAKRRAAACFRSQVEPLSDQPGDETILTPATLARLLRDEETLFLPARLRGAGDGWPAALSARGRAR